MVLESTAPASRNRGDFRCGDWSTTAYRALRCLDAAGIRADVRHVRGSWRPAGSALRVRQDDFPHRRMRDCLRDGLAISIGLEPGLEPDWLEAELDRLAPAMAGYRRARLQWSIESTDPHAERLKTLVLSRFPGSRGFWFEDPALSERADMKSAGSDPSPWPVALHAGVRSHCPLLPAERSRVLLPGNAIAIPADTAWLCLELDLTRVARADGTLQPEGLDAALDCAITGGDTLIDEVTWAGRREADDARMHRRLAVQLTGIGDLVVARSEDPSSLDCLRQLDRLAAYIHDGLWRRSQILAGETSPLAALTERAPRVGWRDESHRRDWSRRWHDAVRQVQVRHRNLLALSPWSLLPRCGIVNPAFADLMPVLAHADAVGFAPHRPPVNWRADDFRYFQARLAAQVERLNVTSFIAIGA